MNILLTNDDGYDAKGIQELYNALKPLPFIESIQIVAPAQDQSATSHSLSINHHLKIKKVKEDIFKVDNGKPSDCVYLALHRMYQDTPPDLVISGINHGCNIGEDVTYSGTVGASMEAILYDVPSIAISQYYEKASALDFALSKEVAVDMVTKIYNNQFPLDRRHLLNINVPNIGVSQSKGYAITKMGQRIYNGHNDIMSNTNPKGEEYHWLRMGGFHFFDNTDEIMTDYEAIMNQQISITPIQLDLTRYDKIGALQEWIKQ